MFGETSRLPFPNPFVGLRPFRTEESLLFFGRNEQTVELLQQLHRTRFLTVVGSSGCGKSSLIRAGLIPKLKAGFLVEDRDRWLTATMKPGDSPLRNLSECLLKELRSHKRSGGNSVIKARLRVDKLELDEATTNANPSDQANFRNIFFAKRLDRLVQNIRSEGSQSLVNYLGSELSESAANVLLVIDQFEEIFRFGVESYDPEKREEAEDFVSLMLALAEQRTLPIYVVMTMRSDFIGDCDNFYGLPEAMNRSQYLVPRLTRQQRQQAIEGPIHLLGASISPRLLDRVLNDVGDKSDQLPVMQHALMRTFEAWQKSGDKKVDTSHYEAVGTLAEALSREADAVLEGLSQEKLKLVEKIFRALTDIGANNTRIRRPIYLSNLCAITGANEDNVVGIVEQLSNNNQPFVTISWSQDKRDALIDITHESLIKLWKQLGNWIDSETSSSEIYKRLASDAQRADRILYSRKSLESVRNWLEREKPTVAWAARYDQRFDLNFDQTIEFINRSFALESQERTRNRLIFANGLPVLFTFVLAFILFIIYWMLRSYTRTEDPNLNNSIVTQNEGVFYWGLRVSTSIIYFMLNDVLAFLQGILEKWHGLSPVLRFGIMLLITLLITNILYSFRERARKVSTSAKSSSDNPLSL